MSLGVLNNISAIYAQNYLNQTQASLQSTLQQLSSGSRINSGADDAAGLAVVDGLHANEAALTQSAQNATNGIGLLQTADGALAQVTNLLNRAVTLATETANGTLNVGQTSSANQEYTNIIAEIGNIGSTTNFNGNSVFSNASNTLFVSDGTASGANTFIDTVGALTTSSVGQSVSTGTISTAAITNPTATASAASVQSTGTITPTAAGDLLSGNIAISLSGGSATAFSVSGVTADQFVTAFNADTAFSSQGISATDVTSTGVITITGPASGIGGSVTFGANNLTSALAGNPDAAPVAAGVTGATDGRSVATFTLSGVSNTLAGTLAVGVGAGASHSINVVPGTTGAALATQINSDATFAANSVSASFNSTTGALLIYGPSGTTHTLSLTGTSLTQTNVLSAGAGVNFTGAGISSLSFNTAQAVLINVTSAIADVAYQRGIVGANINQLTAASNVASAETVNLTSASTTIESTNYGQATSNLAKFEVLSQTGISALAQSNTVQQEILKLLQ